MLGTQQDLLVKFKDVTNGRPEVDTKGKFQEIMRYLGVPLQKTGPFSTPCNDRLFSAFDRHSTGKITFDELIHTLVLLSLPITKKQEDLTLLKEKLYFAFLGFDLDHDGFIEFKSLIPIVKDNNSILFSDANTNEKGIQELQEIYSKGGPMATLKLNFYQYSRLSVIIPELTPAFTFGILIPGINIEASLAVFMEHVPFTNEEINKSFDDKSTASKEKKQPPVNNNTNNSNNSNNNSSNNNTNTAGVNKIRSRGLSREELSGESVVVGDPVNKPSLTNSEPERGTGRGEVKPSLQPGNKGEFTASPLLANKGVGVIGEEYRSPTVIGEGGRGRGRGIAGEGRGGGGDVRSPLAMGGGRGRGEEAIKHPVLNEGTGRGRGETKPLQPGSKSDFPASPLIANKAIGEGRGGGDVRSPLAVGGGRGRGEIEGMRKRAGSSGTRPEDTKSPLVIGRGDLKQPLQGGGGGAVGAVGGGRAEAAKQQQPIPLAASSNANNSSTKEEKTEEGESLEDANKRLVNHVKALQNELKKYMTKVETLEQEVSQYKARESEISERFKTKVKQSYEKGLSDSDKQKTNSNEIKGLKKSVEGYSTVLHFLLADSPEGAVSDHQVIKVGYLQKQGNLVKGQYRKRLFMLRANKQLLYYSTKEKPVPRGMLDLRDCIGMEISKSDLQLLEISMPAGKYSLRAASKEQRDEWAQALMTLMKQPQTHNSDNNSTVSL